MSQYASGQLWGGRFAKELDHKAMLFSSSLSLDMRLWRADIEGSMAHVQMLGVQGILPQNEADQIFTGLKVVYKKIESSFAEGQFPFQKEAEDVHSEIERLLKEEIGPIAGKLHTARSRNDQVATSCRLYLSQEANVLEKEIIKLQTILISLSEQHTETILPGLTHFQHAQPVSLAHHLMAYFWMFERDKARLIDFQKRNLSLPLGSAALAGTSFPLDREYVRETLHFESLAENSLDAVSDRDFVIEFLSFSSMAMMHLSRLCEELIIWSSPEFGFIELDDSVTTGSSIMPQKKNPDMAELIRGKTGRAYGALIGALTMMKSLPLSYNRDLQEDKFYLFQGLDVISGSLPMMQMMLESAEFNKENMKKSLSGDFSNATDLADDLAKKGLPFREAHEVVGLIVRYCLEKKLALENITLAELRKFHTLFDESTLNIISHEAVLKARTSRGGTSPQSVLKQIEEAKKKLI